MNLLDRPEYSFLKTNPHLGKNIIFLTYGGSYAYGTNVEGSDVDIRGCTLNSKADLLRTLKTSAEEGYEIINDPLGMMK